MDWWQAKATNYCLFAIITIDCTQQHIDTSECLRDKMCKTNDQLGESVSSKWVRSSPLLSYAWHGVVFLIHSDIRERFLVGIVNAIETFSKSNLNENKVKTSFFCLVQIGFWESFLAHSGPYTRTAVKKLTERIESRPDIARTEETPWRQ